MSNRNQNKSRLECKQFSLKLQSVTVVGTKSTYSPVGQALLESPGPYRTQWQYVRHLGVAGIKATAPPAGKLHRKARCNKENGCRPSAGDRPPAGLPESPLFIARALRPGAINLFNDRVSTCSCSFWLTGVRRKTKQRREMDV